MRLSHRREVRTRPCLPLSTPARGGIFVRMPKMQVYLPEPLYEQVKVQGGRLNVSKILQDALSDRLAELARHDALGVAIDAYEAEASSFSEAELAAYAEADRAAMKHPRKKKRSSAA